MFLLVEEMAISADFHSNSQKFLITFIASSATHRYTLVVSLFLRLLIPLYVKLNNDIYACMCSKVIDPLSDLKDLQFSSIHCIC